MPITVRVADAKRRLSELMSRVAYKGERFLIQRRNIPMVALVPAADLELLEQGPATGPGLLAAIGAWAEFDELEQVVEDIYQQRSRAKDRPVPGRR